MLSATLAAGVDLRRLMTSNEASCFDAWSLMESAPRDGSEVLCFTVTRDFEIAHWLPVSQCWVSKRGILVEPTRWMRLPDSPDRSGKEEKDQAQRSR